jgi:hypothetical protein
MALRYGGEVEPELWSELSALGQATVSNGWRALLMPNGYPTYRLTEMRLLRPGDLLATFKSLVHEVPRELQEFLRSYHPARSSRAVAVFAWTSGGRRVSGLSCSSHSPATWKRRNWERYAQLAPGEVFQERVLPISVLMIELRGMTH